MKPVSKIIALMICYLLLSWPVSAQSFSLDDLKKLADDIRKIRAKVSTEEEIQLGGNLISGLLGAALLDVLTTIDSINPEEESLTVMLKTHPPIADRLNKLANTMDGKLDEYASGRSNPTRFLKLADNISQTN
ncbi:MAG: hypothetical protein ACC663_02830 [Gammaproteobacteria bacterium]